MDKIALAQKIKSLTGLSNEEKHNLLDLLDTKIYGLVWETKPEAVDEKLKTQLPCLKEVIEKRIVSERKVNLNTKSESEIIKLQTLLDFGVKRMFKF